MMILRAGEREGKAFFMQDGAMESSDEEQSNNRTMCSTDYTAEAIRMQKPAPICFLVVKLMVMVLWLSITTIG